MGFLDDLRSQSKSKEEVVQEERGKLEQARIAEEDALAKTMSKNWPKFFSRAEERVKECITKSAKSGEYQLTGSKKIICGTTSIATLLTTSFYFGIDFTWLGTDFLDFGVEPTSLGIEPYVELLRGGGYFHNYRSLFQIDLKFHHPDLVRKIYFEAIQKLQDDGIEANYIMKWTSGKGPVHCTYMQDYPLEQAISGYQTRKWIPPDLCKIRGPSTGWQHPPKNHSKYYLLYHSIDISCTYKCKF